MTKITIYKRYFYDADCYSKGIAMTPKGVQVHSTGANSPWLHRYVQPDDGRIGGNTYNNHHNKPGLAVCAHAYIGRQTNGTVAVYQTLPWTIRCWLSGSGERGNANKMGYVGFEICEDGLVDAVYFQRAVREQAAMLTAYLCQTFNADPIQMVKDHAELHDAGLASNHGDIRHWLRKFGYNMDDFREWVSAYLADGIEATYIDCDEVNFMYQAKVTCTGAYLNLRAGKSTSTVSLAKLNKGETVEVINDSDPEWWYVWHRDATGYAMQKYLTPIEQDAGDQTVQQPEAPDPGTDVQPQSADQCRISRNTLNALKALIVPLAALIPEIENALKGCDES